MVTKFRSDSNQQEPAFVDEVRDQPLALNHLYFTFEVSVNYFHNFYKTKTTK